LSTEAFPDDCPPALGAWPLSRVCQLSGEWLPGLEAQAVGRIDSTNSELMRRLRAGLIRPTLLVAESQSAGRGRQGRTWHDADAPPRTRDAMPASLMFSLSRDLAPTAWSGLSLAVGVAIADALHPQLALKWPNDLWWHGRKLGGILIETAHVGTRRHAVVGVGLNVRQPALAGLAVEAAWSGEFLPDDAAQLLLKVVPALAQALARFERHGLAPFLPGFAARDLLRDKPVWMSDGTRGVARGIDGDGGLLVHTSGGMKTVTSLEVSVRPEAGSSGNACVPGA
jgi:BirA family transcriptional regulator, biotin operon repressor / biotin---[acetyl-CoA-carboxylase] ligase